jgi:hypothetical protein
VWEPVSPIRAKSFGDNGARHPAGHDFDAHRATEKNSTGGMLLPQVDAEMEESPSFAGSGRRQDVGAWSR